MIDGLPASLDGINVAALVTNIPGPLCAARLASLGATVVKIEPAAGDPLESDAPQWYAEIVRGVRVRRLDLRAARARQEFEALLSLTDVLLTTMRASALQRLALDWESLRERHPRLIHVAIFGETPPNDDRAGHDLTYQARAGLLTPPAMPRTLVGDLAAAERAVSDALAALLLRERTGAGTRVDVGIVDAAQSFSAPLDCGLTAETGPLGGGLDCYGLYRSADGWIAVATLEPHFAQRLRDVLACSTLDRDTLGPMFAQRTSETWERIAHEHDIPIAAVRVPRGVRPWI